VRVCVMESKEETAGAGEASLEGLPSALVATVMTKLDIASICSLASTSSAFRSCGRHILSFLPSFNLLVPFSLLTFFFLIFCSQFPKLILLFLPGHCSLRRHAQTLVAAQSLPHHSQARLFPPRRLRHRLPPQTLPPRPLSPQLRRFQWQTLV